MRGRCSKLGLDGVRVVYKHMPGTPVSSLCPAHSSNSMRTASQQQNLLSPVRPCPYLSLSLTYLAAIFLAACPASPACVPSLILGPPTCTCSTLQVIAGCRCEDVTSTRYKESRSHCPEWMREQQVVSAQTLLQSTAASEGGIRQRESVRQKKIVHQLCLAQHPSAATGHESLK